MFLIDAKTKGEIIVLYILMFIFLGSKLDERKDDK